MELKSLILGVFVSVAVFALKSGGGLAYVFLKFPGVLPRLWISLLFAAGYGIVFGAAAYLLHAVDLTGHPDLLQDFFKSGMTLHFLLAGLLLFWGVSLLRQNKTRHPSKISHSWIALVVPCPVCFSVILLSLGFLTALYPDQPLVFAGLYAGFIGVSLCVAIAGTAIIRNSGSAETALGILMLFIALYFLLSVIVIPQFADLDRIYRISGTEDPIRFSPEKAVLAVLSVAALAAGFFNPFKRKS